MSTYGLVVAAGSGTRFGRSKATVELAGRPLWRWGFDALVAGGCDEVIVVGESVGGINGGARRRDSVAAGLSEIPAGTEIVVVHDAARPLASPELVRVVIEAVRDGAGGAVPGIPVRDTIKRIQGDRVIGTLDRAELVAVQTPQAFLVDVLLSAHAADDGDATDDAVLVERAGGSVVVVPGEDANIKITYPGDLAIAEGLVP